MKWSPALLLLTLPIITKSIIFALDSGGNNPTHKLFIKPLSLFKLGV
ncbi:hypothetical protein WIW90_05540 [Sulfolobaceae archaeon RB850M]